MTAIDHGRDRARRPRSRAATGSAAIERVFLGQQGAEQAAGIFGFEAGEMVGILGQTSLALLKACRITRQR